MNMSLRYPNITGRTEREQLAQVNSYLRQMVDQLNFALQGQGGTGLAGADGKDGKKGADGKTPQKGVDYWTDEDVKQIVDAAVEGVLKEKVKILEASMPVGYLYASNSPTDPKTLFGFGTWERVEDCFILAAGSTYAAGSTGGKATHTLTVNEMPEHKHTRGTMNITGEWSINSDANNAGLDAPNTGTGAIVAKSGGGTGSAVTGTGWTVTTGFKFDASKSWSGSTSSVGGSQPHNNMPPYYAMYMWIRTA